MLRKKIRVPQEVIDQCSEHYCADTLDMYEPAKSRGKVFVVVPAWPDPLEF